MTAATKLHDHFRKFPWFISVGEGRLRDGRAALFVYVKSAEHKELRKLRFGWMGYDVQIKPIKAVRPLDLMDQLYLAFGRCCAGCDFWEHDPGRTRPMGYCHKQILGETVNFDMEFRGSVSRGKELAVTSAKHVCPKFQDTFDWAQLGVENPPWLDQS